MAALATIACSLSALLLPTPPPAKAPLTRRGAVQAAGASFAAVAFGAAPAFAEQQDFSKLGGLLEPYVETQKGFKLYVPTGWNKFDADPGVYDVKFQDIIEPETTVQVSTSPVATATSITALGDIAAVGEKFAKSRSAQVVSTVERDVDGSLVYVLELKGEVYHEYLALCINRGKLYRVTAVTSNKKWQKRAELYKNVVNSFVPKGF
eukprot:CAMPEP_0115848644 /NCGR_PEP_ID=MMETSP0287-20121206/11032_1 /TAXON_ID=412157 /ORGANISM="Chrysochromulina rotalis, Strain UIO044" /LENGTH=206 /DNA_ID=CAMNT_0003302571 /DNA_START=22 /DNA_END=642 /DNA_ORIENTATION=-